MKRLSSSNTTEELEVDLTSMLDVVFIMLIFFVVTAVIVHEHGLGILKPPLSVAKNNGSQKIIFTISGSNEIWLDERLIDPPRCTQPYGPKESAESASIARNLRKPQRKREHLCWNRRCRLSGELYGCGADGAINQH